MKTFSKSYTLPFPLGQVYSAWISNDTIIPPVSSMEVEAKIGGVYRLTMPDGSTAEGTFSAIVPNERVCYSWQWAGSGESTEVDVRFSERSRGTAVDIEHRGFRSESSLRDHSLGWDSYMAGLESHLNTRR